MRTTTHYALKKKSKCKLGQTISKDLNWSGSNETMAENETAVYSCQSGHIVLEHISR